ncbi:tyrosine-type recombinase/integrase [Microvirga sp. 2TAF3]|uniref:tyrosine-type recombinase/integrase n=1 Tax=Microvirga sp. 2TAF3 TaxID=3233014 RepID=UPI003F9BCA86
MATIRKRGNSWQVQVRRQGFSSLAQSFSTHADAVAWARDKERSIDRSEILPNHRSLKAVRLHDLLDRYEREVTPKKRGADREIHKLRILKAHDVAKAGLDKISGRMIASYRDDRLKLVSSGTVRRELAILQHCFEVARKEWDLPILINPVRQITLPKAGNARQRRLNPDEIETFWAAVDRARAPWMKPFITLAIETGMRRGELLAIRWEDIDAASQTLHVRQTKNGYERTIPLTPCACRTFLSMQREAACIFPVTPWQCARHGSGLLYELSLKI